MLETRSGVIKFISELADSDYEYMLELQEILDDKIYGISKRRVKKCKSKKR